MSGLFGPTGLWVGLSGAGGAGVGLVLELQLTLAGQSQVVAAALNISPDGHGLG